ncbi:MAG: PAS domain-containing protein [Anaerolineae bacterium]|nr:PAS domain-containing protein [Anaerolineae bacterium]
MYWYVTAVSLLLLLAAAISLVFALYAWKRRPVPGAVAFSVFMLAVVLWILAYLLQVVSDDPVTKAAWAKLQFVGVSILPVAWLVFSLRYTNRQAWLTPRRWVMLMFVPLLTLLFTVTNEFHQLVWVRFDLSFSGGLSHLEMIPGVWYWIFVVYLYGAFLAGSLMLLTSTRYEISSLVYQQALVLLTGLALPWFGGVFYVTGMSTINLTPLAFAFCGFVVAKYPLNFRFVKRTPLENQMVLNSLDAGVLVLDSDCVIVDANPAMIKIAKRPLSTFLGSKLSDIFPNVAAEYDLLQVHSIEIGCDESRHNDCYEVKRFPLEDWRKLVSSEMLIFNDISERKQRETLREDLTQSMVHDLRSPISNSLFALEMLRSGTIHPNDAEGERLVELTFENTEKVLKLVNEILDVGRLENGTIPVKLTAVSLIKLVDQVLLSQSPRAEAKNITLIRDIPPDVPVAWADENLLERIVQNLVDNSLKFAPVGGYVKVTAVVINKQDKQHRQIHVTVSDNGPGLPPLLVETIFDKFVTGSERESGNGLGLAFCQMALAAHNQKIWVERQSKHGTAFTFSLALPPQLPEDIHIEDEWSEIFPNSSKPNLLLSQATPNW